MYLTIIFYRANPPALSPSVTLQWPGKVVDLFNRFPVDVWGNGNRPERLTVNFAAACGADPKVGGVELLNVPLRWDRALSGEAWVRWLNAEFVRLTPEVDGKRWLPVMVDLDPPFHATRDGKVLCRRVREDEQKPGQPLWVQVDRPAVVTFSRSGSEYRDFSNSASYPTKIDRQWWPSVEHYFQAQKFVDRAYRDTIRKADFIAAPRLAQDREQKVRPDWEAVKVEVMRTAVLAKFTQNEELREQLLSTDDAELVDASGNDYGGDKNLLGRVLMEVRARLRATTASPDSVAPQRRGKARGGRPVAAPETGVCRTVIFYRADMGIVSPAVRVRWPGKVFDLFNQLRNAWADDTSRGWCGGGNMPEAWCADFVSSCCAAPEIGAGRVELHNVPLPWEQHGDPVDEMEHAPDTPEFDEEWRKWEDGWRKRLFKEIRRLFEHGGEELPVLVDTFLPSRAIQGGKMVFRMVRPNEHEPDGPVWVEPGKQVRPKRAVAPVREPVRSAKKPPEVPLTLYESYTVEKAVAALGDLAAAEFYCDRQFAVVGRTTLCFATMGDPDTGTKVQSPSLVVWKPGRLDYHPKANKPWFPGPLCKCVERNGAYVPLHHMFLRAPGDKRFVYAGIAELPMFGDIPENGRIQQSAQFFLDTRLPRDLWVRLGGYPGWLVGFNGTQQRFAADDVAGFERLLSEVTTTAGSREVTLTGYEERCLAIQFNDKRAHLTYRPLYWPFKLGDERGVESWDPDCSEPRRREFFGNGVVVPARRTVPVKLAVRAAVEHFRTAQLPECVRWRELKDGT